MRISQNEVSEACVFLSLNYKDFKISGLEAALCSSWRGSPLCSGDTCLHISIQKLLVLWVKTFSNNLCVVILSSLLLLLPHPARCWRKVSKSKGQTTLWTFWFSSWSSKPAKKSRWAVASQGRHSYEYSCVHKIRSFLDILRDFYSLELPECPTPGNFKGDIWEWVCVLLTGGLLRTAWWPENWYLQCMARIFGAEVVIPRASSGERVERL